MGSSPGFASTTPDYLALFRLAFAAAPPLKGLTWPGTVTRRIIMQKARGQAGLRQRPPTACRRGVSGSLSSPVGVLPIVRSRYCCAIGRQGVLSLAGWSPPIQTGFHVPDPTRVPVRGVFASPTGLSPAVVRLSRRLRLAFTHPTSLAPRPRVVSHTV